MLPRSATTRGAARSRRATAAARQTTRPRAHLADVTHDQTEPPDLSGHHTHRAHIIDTGNESWRFRHGLERKAKKGT
jgi:hypothetical protein